MSHSQSPTRKVLATILVVITLTGCSKNAASVAEPVDTANHTISIENRGSRTNLVTPKQFTSMVVTPTDQSSSAQTYSFVSSPNTTVAVKVKLPKTGLYKIQIYVAQGGKSIWWNSLALEVNGTTPITLSTDHNGYAFYSQALGGIPSSGNDIGT